MLNLNRRLPALPVSTPPPRNRGGKMTPRAAARAAATTTITRFAILALLLATLAVVTGGMLGAPDAGEASSHWTDYDEDNDGLIDITTLAQLNAVRHDLFGDGDPTSSSGAAAYNAAFPDRNASSGGRMGCPSGTCTGYELMNSLDFDTDGDGDVDTDDAYANWAPSTATGIPFSNRIST